MTSSQGPQSSSSSPNPALPVPESEATDSQSVASETAQRSVFPMAKIRDAKATTSALILQSKMWWVTLGCLVIAFWMTWQSIPSRGPTIVIQFPDGHGIKAGDAVRHRGIEAGIVDSVSLSE